MFSAFLPTSGGDEEEEVNNGGEGDEEQERGGGGGVFSFFEMAKEVAANVQNSTTEIVQSVAVTDWTKELRDFGSSLQQDTQDMVEETKAAVKDNNESIGLALPKSKEDVQESMEFLGNTLEAFGKNLIGGTTELLSQVKDTVNQEMQAASIKHRQLQKEKAMKQKRGGKGEREGAAAHREMKDSQEEIKRKRFEEKVNAMQRDSGTYCDEPEDFEYFETWQSNFDLDEHEDEVQATLKGNAFMLELQERIVPLIVDRGTFWTQYFFRLHMIKLEEGMATRVSERRAEDEKENKKEEDLGTGTPEAETCATDSAPAPVLVESAVEVAETEPEAQAQVVEEEEEEEEIEEPKEPKEPKESEEREVSQDSALPTIDDGGSSSCASSVQTESPRHDMGDGPGHSRSPSGLMLSEPDAATASDSSANDWINVKAKSRGSPASQSPQTLERLHEQNIKADDQASQPSPLKEEKDDKKLESEEEQEKEEICVEDEEEELSPLPSPAGGKYDESIDDDDIDEDWGEM